MFENLVGRSPNIPYDVRFVFGVHDNLDDSNEDPITVFAHKFILSLGRNVFKTQFFGPMKETTFEIHIVDANPEL